MKLYAAVLVAVMLITGTANTLTKKLQNKTMAPGLSNVPHEFSHPWFQTWIMFLGELACLLPLVIQRYRIRKERNTMKIDDPEFKRYNHSLYSPIFILPTVCDLIGSTLAGIGLLYTPASVWQMFRGSIIIFGGVLSMIFLKKRLVLRQWAGMGIVFLGLAAVGVSSLLGDDKSSFDTKLIIGIVLILAGQLSNAIQMVVEETFLKKHDYPPLHVVGMEGLNGSIIMAFIVLPVCYFIPAYDNANAGSYENFLDAIVQIYQSPILLVFILGYVISIAFYNFTGLSVAKELSTIHRTLIDACRTVLVWAVNLVVFYAGAPEFGEGWGKYSWLQLIGFVLLLAGTATYNGAASMIKNKFCAPKEVAEVEQQPLIAPTSSATPTDDDT